MLVAREVDLIPTVPAPGLLDCYPWLCVARLGRCPTPQGGRIQLKEVRSHGWPTTSLLLSSQAGSGGSRGTLEASLSCPGGEGTGDGGD